jgi:hypothetical protein
VRLDVFTERAGCKFCDVLNAIVLFRQHELPSELAIVAFSIGKATDLGQQFRSLMPVNQYSYLCKDFPVVLCLLLTDTASKNMAFRRIGFGHPFIMDKIRHTKSALFMLTPPTPRIPRLHRSFQPATDKKMVLLLITLAFADGWNAVRNVARMKYTKR